MLQTTRLVLVIGLFLRSVSFLNWSCIVFATFSEFSRSVLCWSRAGCDCRLWLASLCCCFCSSTGQKWAVSIRWCWHLVSTADLTFKDLVFRQLTNLNRRCDKGHKILFFLELMFLPFTVSLYFSRRRFLVVLKIGFLRFFSPFFPFFKLVMVWSLTTMHIDTLGLI